MPHFSVYFADCKINFLHALDNTGNDFVYNDNFKKSKYESDKEGFKQYFY